MAKNIDPQLVKVGEYLKLDEDVKFEIPEYQRSYAWDITRCDKLWSDIKDFIENGSKDPYFFGTIIISCEKNDSRYSLIDGQQRTTTFMLLLKALLIQINKRLLEMIDDEESDILKSGLKERRRNITSILYQVDVDEITDFPKEEKDRKIYNQFNNLINNSNQEIYKQDLVNIMTSVSLEEAEAKVTKIPYKQKDNKYTNFFRNFKHFYEKEELNQTEFLNKFSKVLLESCQVIEIKSWNVEQAITMFNSLNSDGMPLTDSDIIYSKMFAAVKTEDERKLLGRKWRYLIELTKGIQNEKIISINSLLNQKMYLYRSKDGDTINASGNIDVTTPGLRRYYTDINQEHINNPIEFCNELIILAYIWNIVKDSAIIKVLFYFNDNSKLFLASYFSRFDHLFSFDTNEKINIKEEDKNYLIKNVEIIGELMLRLFTILSLVDTGYSSSNFKSFLFNEEIKLANLSIDNTIIVEDFNKHINKNWEKEYIKLKLEEYEKNDIVYLNEYLFAKDSKLEFNITSDIDIEHIMPQSGKNINTIQQDAKIENADMWREYVNKIGNKILLEYDINRSIGNEWFRTKVSTRIKDKSGYIDSKYPLARFLVEKYENQNKPFWTKDDIDNMTKEAVNRIAKFIFND